MHPRRKLSSSIKITTALLWNGEGEEEEEGG